jgi:hypothetical protein
MSQQLIDPNLLFQTELVIRPTKSGKLTAKHQLPFLGGLAGKQPYAKVQIGYQQSKLFVAATIGGKTKPTLSVEDGSGRGDKFRFWIDTRSSPGVHRATKYCHCFNISPPTSSPTKGRVLFEPIPRAREIPRNIDCSEIILNASSQADGYSLLATFPNSVLNGFDPSEFPEIGLFYSVVDSELGVQTLGVGPEMKYNEDPTFWLRGRFV